MKYLIFTIFIFITTYGFSCTSEADWVDHYLHAEYAVGERNGHLAIAELSKAIELKNDELFLYVQRGQIFMKMGLYDNAVQDFTHVIESPNVHVSLLLPSLRGRAGAYLRIDGGDVCFPKDMSRNDRFHLDFDRAEALDPNVSYYAENEFYEITTNFGMEINNPEFQAQHCNNMIALGLCEDPNDIQYFANGVIVMKLRKHHHYCEECANSHLKKKSAIKDTQSCVSCGEELKKLVWDGKEIICEQGDCKYWCDRISETAKDLCSETFKTFKCREACREVVRQTTKGCYWCCSSGGFYQNCVKPFEDFITRVGCEEPIW